MAIFEGSPGRQVGRATLAVGESENLVIYHDKPGTPPSSWALVVLDPNGGSAVNWTTSHNEVTFESPTALVMVGGLNVYGFGTAPGPYGSSVTVRITAATAGTFKAMLVRVNT